jgi:hypothetical protein
MKQCVLSFIITIVSFNAFAVTLSKPLDPVVFSIHLPKEQAWQKVMDLFVANSIPIKLMDKSSGLIQSERIGLGTHYGLKGTKDSTSWALCDAIPSGESNFYLFPQVINTELQVYVREVDGGNVLLSVNLMNSKATSYNAETDFTREFDVQSSKVLENTIGSYIKTNEKMPTLTFDPPFATYGEPPSQIKKRKDLADKLNFNEATGKDNNGGLILGLIVIIAVAFALIGGEKK